MNLKIWLSSLSVLVLLTGCASSQFDKRTIVYPMPVENTQATEAFKNSCGKPIDDPDGWNNLGCCTNSVTSDGVLFREEVLYGFSPAQDFRGYTDYYSRRVNIDQGVEVSTTGTGYTSYKILLQAIWTGSGWRDKNTATAYLEKNGFTVLYEKKEINEIGEPVWIPYSKIPPVSYTTFVTNSLPVTYNEYTVDAKDGCLTYFLEATLTVQEGIEGSEYKTYSERKSKILTVHKTVKKNRPSSKTAK